MTPAAVNSTKFIDIAPGAYHTCGVSTNHDLYCWGMIGAINTLSPVNISSNQKFKSIISGDLHR